MFNERGFFEGMEASSQHCHDPMLCNELVTFFQREKAESIVDFGCGMGDYVKVFLKNRIKCK